MSSVDKRVVEMGFDNASFEKKIADTMKSLDSLSTKIDSAGAKKGLQNLADSANRFNLSGMSASIEGISTKFLALSTIGITVLSNIVNRAVDAGIRIAKSLSLDTVMGGFREYETNMNAIQTILSNTFSKGTGLDDVNAALDQLNTYADQTIYNFGEMARNIGTFTAAGVDLDTSVSAIKGIANLAAISGSNSQQASTAMYQLSQAISSGTVRLMDWNSVVNAGMGGEVFQSALFETGKMMGTIADIPMDMTFQQWTDAGNSFRGSLETGWLTADVLTNTLQGFTGDLTEAQIMSMGYTAEQTAAIMQMGQIGKDAATKVKTLTQLIDTVKEAIGSGWSTSFRTIIGDFEQARELFTTISEAIGAIVGESADSRNEILSDWAQLGGRAAIIQGMTNIFQTLGRVLGTIKDAFREFFPRKTGADLAEMSDNFRAFTNRMEIGEVTLKKIKRIFKGVFAGLEIGVTVIKEIAKGFGELFSGFADQNGSGILNFFARVGDALVRLNDKLVEGGGIADFFARLKEIIKDPMVFIDELKAKIVDFFSGTGIPDGLTGASGIFGRLSQRFAPLIDAIRGMGDAWAWLSDKLGPVKEVLEGIFTGIRDWFKNLGSRLAAVFQPGDFDAALDGLNVGLLAGVGLMLKKLTDGVNFNFGGDFFASATRSLDQLTSTLSTMQTDIKANALLKIAGAVGILTASVLILSMIDSVALTKALTAMAVGFGQLMAAFALITRLGIGPASAANMTLIATGLMILAGAVLVLSAAVKILSTMSWEELAKGLGGVIVLIGTLVAATTVLSNNAGGMIRAGLGLMGLSVAILILAGAVKIFATMTWEELGRGLAGVGGGLALIAAGMHLMPSNMVITGLGLMFVALALNGLAAAMKIFATMSWEDMGKGLVGVGGGLLLIAGAMQLMPMSMVVTSVGLLAVAVALNIIAGAMKQMAGMSWEEIGKGLAGIGGSLLVLALGLHLMSGAVAGAIALTIAAAGLTLLAGVVKEFARLKLQDLGMALLGMAAIFAVIGGAAFLLAPVIPAMMGLGVALLLVGAGFALFGLGAQAMAKAIEMLAKSGSAGIDVLMDLFRALLSMIPEIVAAFGVLIIELAKVLAEAAPPLIKSLAVVMDELLNAMIDLVPKIAETIGVVITETLMLIQEKAPEFIETGFMVLMALLSGIRDNIGEIVTVVADIITGFLDALALKVPEIIDSVYNLLWAVINGVMQKMADVASVLVPKGVELLGGLLQGISDKAPEVWEWFTSLPGLLLEKIGDVASWLLDKGIDFITGLLEGVVQKAVEVTTWFTELPGKIFNWIGTVVDKLKQKGIDFLAGLMTGINEKVGEVTTWFQQLPQKIFDWIVGASEKLVARGKDFITGLYNGVITKVNEIVIPWFNALPGKIRDWIPNAFTALWNTGLNFIAGLWNGMKEKAEGLLSWAAGIADTLVTIFTRPWELLSPSRVMYRIGGYFMEGLEIGMHEGAPKVVDEVEQMNENLRSKMAEFSDMLSNLEEFNPVITPVIDLTAAKKDAKIFGGLFEQFAQITPDLAYAQANRIQATIAGNADGQLTPEQAQAAVNEIKFEQNIYAPTELSTADIYRQTKNQINMAKEALHI